MIAEFKIRNYSSLREEQTLSFIPTSDSTSREIYTEEVANGVRLLKIGCIYGSNASGKTNILNALEYFASLMTDTSKKRGDGTGVIPFLLDDMSYKKTTEFEMTFYLEGERYILNVELDNNIIYRETLTVYSSVQPTLLYNRSYNKETDSTDIKFGTKSGISKKSRGIIEGNTIVNRTVIAAFGISNVEKSKLNLVYSMFSERIVPVMRPTNPMTDFVKGKLKRRKSESLKRFILHFLKASDFNISNISLHNEENLYFTHNTKNGERELEEQLESMGTRRFLGLATILYDLLSQSVVFPIDEIESSIHYELLSYFLKVFLVNSKRQSQLILTTHDINLLDEDYIRRDIIWFTDKDEEGTTQLLRLSSMSLHKSISVYNAYRQEKLIDLPFLDSIYLDSKLYETTES